MCQQSHESLRPDNMISTKPWVYLWDMQYTVSTQVLILLYMLIWALPKTLHVKFIKRTLSYCLFHHHISCSFISSSQSDNYFHLIQSFSFLHQELYHYMYSFPVELNLQLPLFPLSSTCNFRIERYTQEMFLFLSQISLRTSLSNVLCFDCPFFIMNWMPCPKEWIFSPQNGKKSVQVLTMGLQPLTSVGGFSNPCVNDGIQLPACLPAAGTLRQGCQGLPTRQNIDWSY